MPFLPRSTRGFPTAASEIATLTSRFVEALRGTSHRFAREKGGVFSEPWKSLPPIKKWWFLLDDDGFGMVVRKPTYHRWWLDFEGKYIQNTVGIKAACLFSVNSCTVGGPSSYAHWTPKKFHPHTYCIDVSIIAISLHHSLAWCVPSPISFPRG